MNIEQEEIMRISDEEFEKNILQIIANMDGEDIKHFENEVNPSLCDRVMIASFVASRQVLVTVNKIVSYAKDVGRKAKCPRQRKNIDTEWCVVDCGSLMIHLFKNEAREYYDLDNFFIVNRRSTFTEPLNETRVDRTQEAALREVPQSTLAK